MGRKARVAILTNIIAPYRVPVSQKIGEQFETFIFYSGEEQNRAAWKGVEAGLQSHVVKKSWGLTLQLVQGRRDGVYDYRYLHINPGYFVDLLRTRPDAVISSQMGFRTLVALLYGTLFRTPVWVGWEGTVHSERNVGTVKKILRRVIARWAKLWISFGEAPTEYLLSLGVPKERILITQSRVDERIFLKPTEPAIRLEPRPVFLYAGQFIGRKGIDELLKVAAEQQKKHRFSLLLVGDGPQKAALEDLARELGLRDVYFYPVQRPEAMPAIYRSADYLVFPTMEDVWGLIVNEALWSGVPVLCSVYAGCARELLPEENLFDPLNHDSFASTFERALEGRISPPDLSRLKTHGEVADMIINDLKRVLEV